MTTHLEAEENLRVIRSLMERSTIYRAISAPTALIGGLLSILTCMVFRYAFHDTDLATGERFLLLWLVTLALTMMANTWLIWRGARQRSERFVSSGMKLALISLLPSMLCGAFFTYNFAFEFAYFHAFSLPPIWMLCYGVGLLSTSHFAPRSITVLGWVFLFSGFVAYLYLQNFIGLHVRGTFPYFAYASNFVMGATFGLYHLIYAACTWPRKSAAGEP